MKRKSRRKWRPFCAQNWACEWRMRQTTEKQKFYPLIIFCHNKFVRYISGDRKHAGGIFSASEKSKEQWGPRRGSEKIKLPKKDFYFVARQKVSKVLRFFHSIVMEQTGPRKLLLLFPLSSTNDYNILIRFDLDLDVRSGARQVEPLTNELSNLLLRRRHLRRVAVGDLTKISDVCSSWQKGDGG